jgi:hypothetical protein
MVEVLPASVEWLEALAMGDVFSDRFGIPVVAGWVGGHPGRARRSTAPVE